MSRSPKRLRSILRNPNQHWVGDGFPVRSLFSYPGLGAVVSPFLLFDYAGPRYFPPTTARLGVGEHPHRGFETVTIVYSGQVDHRDSTGAGGTIAAGDVQWMTASAGIVHEEMHGHDFAREGGDFEMVQLWVNLPAQDKWAPPGYQSIVAADIPTVTLADGQSTARLIAGSLDGTTGPAHTFTPMSVWDLRIAPGAKLALPAPDGWTTLLAVLHGEVVSSGCNPIGEAEVGLFETGGDHLEIVNSPGATALLLTGQPLEEPVVGRGPFVMNTEAEIAQAFYDYRAGRMGHLS